MDIHFITGNKNKFNEARKIIPRLVQLDIDLVEIQHHDPHVIIEYKLREAQRHNKGALMVEDTALYLDCINGLPGPLIKWFVDRMGTEGLYDIAAKYGIYTAHATTIIGYCDSQESIVYFEGSISGQIVPPHGKTAFGWDPIFVPDGHALTFAQMTKEQKTDISMRTIACQKLSEYINTSI